MIDRNRKNFRLLFEEGGTVGLPDSQYLAFDLSKSTYAELRFLHLESKQIGYFTSGELLHLPLLLMHEDKLSAMRCLYCGVELALLKKLAGSENFCSDAHRVAYQEEFSRLALNRLMQSQPPSQKKSFANGFNGAAQAAELENITYPNLAAVQETILEQHGRSSNNNAAGRMSSAALADADLQPLEMDLATQGQPEQQQDPQEAGFLIEKRPLQIVRPRPLSNEEPVFRFTQYAMPSLKAAIVDETPMPAPVTFRRPERILQAQVTAELELMDELAFPIPLNLTPARPGGAGPGWKQLPAVNFDIQGLQYIDFLRSSGGRPKPADSGLTAFEPVLEVPQPDTPARMDVLSNLSASRLEFRPMEPNPPKLISAMPDVAFPNPEISKPEFDLATLHTAVIFAPKSEPEAQQTASPMPSLKKVPMTQEPPPTLPDILPKTKNVTEIKRQKKVANQPSSPVGITATPPAPAPKTEKPKLAPPADVQKPKGKSPAPAGPAAPITKATAAVPHPAPVESPTKPPSILRPGPVEAPTEMAELGADENNSPVFEMSGEIGPSPGFIQLLPIWVKILLAAAVLAIGAYIYTLISGPSKTRSSRPQRPAGQQLSHNARVATGRGLQNMEKGVQA